MEQDFFDIESLHKNFTAALKDDTDVVMDFYLEGYKELSKYESNNSISTTHRPLNSQVSLFCCCFSKGFSN